ncbi:sulfatase-like hydrolase/transferase [Fibrobacter sp.]|uniref:LTA synthase family protein n=1 Tax=Fibrobacter sp. TaxID=35828 RepID=UPI0025B89093|nr:sulfatase-like hydrolase/transferase [Fibrobacter sp.]MBR3071170.1 sulfatase-like hydrolase/transferase [Fibrobacter sp.]
MNFFYWFIFAWILIVGRFALLWSLYLPETPMGGSLVVDYNRFIWHTLYAEIGFAMAASSIFFLISLFVKGKGLRIVKIVSIVFAAIYLGLSGADDEVMRWMGQKLSFSFIDTYKNAAADTVIFSSIFRAGMFHFFLTIGIVVATVVAASIFSRKMNLSGAVARPLHRKTKIALALTLLFAVLGCTSHLWYNYSIRRWARIKPVCYTFAGDILELLQHQSEPPHFREGIIALGGNPDSKYPFWHESANEKENLEAFKAEPLSKKPDIILLSIESLRGWSNDMRIEKNCKRSPNLCKLVQNGIFYPNTHSVGAPSIEGMLGLMLGIRSYPKGTLYNSYPNTRMRALPEVLSAAGYYTEVLLCSDPKFANEEKWFSKWFDYYEYDPKNEDDVSLADRFVERYRERDRSKPTFYYWISHSMHFAFELPDKYGPTPSDLSEAYLRAEAFMDSSLGLIFNAVAQDSNAANTLFIVVGDHSYPNSGQMPLIEKYGQIFDAFSWISMAFAGPGLTPRIETQPVSQGDIAKSIISYLNLDVSNHFMGINLLTNIDSTAPQTFPPVYSFRLGDMAMRRDSLSFFLTPVEGEELAIVRKSYLQPTWDTTDVVEGFVVGEPVEIPKQYLQTTTDSMRAAANAWEYLLAKNLLMPESK